MLENIQNIEKTCTVIPHSCTYNECCLLHRKVLLESLPSLDLKKVSIESLLAIIAKIHLSNVVSIV